MTVGASDGSNDVANFYDGTSAMRPAGELRGVRGGNPHIGHDAAADAMRMPFPDDSFDAA